MFIMRNTHPTFDNSFRTLKRFNNSFSPEFHLEQNKFTPKVNIFETDKNLNVIFEIPGVKKEDVNITINDEGILTIKGDRKSNLENNNENYLIQEILFGEFSRSFKLPNNIDSENIKAKFNNGILEVSIPKVLPEDKEINVQIN